MKKVLITGANGQLGRALTKVYGDTAILITTDVAGGFERLDITDFDEVNKFIRHTKPDVVINCAAMTNVDKCEEDIDLAYKLNAIGPRNLAIVCNKLDCKLIHVSTDYVFSGYHLDPYTEFDRPAPSSMYGSTKLRGEEFVKQFCNKWFIFRTAWLYGDGHNFVNTMLRLAETKDEVDVVEDQVGTPTSALELARCIKAYESTEEYGLYHATCKGSTNWAEFAKTIFEKAGLDVKVNPISSYKYRIMNPQTADRPAYSILENKMMEYTGKYTMANWEDAFNEYMEGINDKI